jgi:HlyD family secretion protein
VNYTVVVDASNEKGILLPGMTATVDFLVEERRDVLLVPNTALNFKPSMELIKKYGQQMTGKMKQKAPGQGMNQMPDRLMGFDGGMMGGKLADHMGRVFYLDEKGIPTSAVLVKGTTDGKMTEITRSKDLKEGLQVITAYQTGKSSKSKSQRSAIFPPRPGGGPH